MQISDFDYELPPELIAQRPVEPRDSSRLLVTRRHPSTAAPAHRHFRDLPDLLTPGDVLVVNDARVLPARVRVTRHTGGGVELLFLGPLDGLAWRALARPARRVRPGDRLSLPDGTGLEVVSAGEAGERGIRAEAGGSLIDVMERFGAMPLPPYVRRDAPEASALEALDRERYQTVYADTPGAVAAPTAGLHFTPELLARLAAKGVGMERITLHVGPGTFRPVTTDRVEDHRMDRETCRIAQGTADRLNAARAAGRRLIAVGTTSVRTLEHAWGSGGVRPGERQADLFIRPGYEFRAIDGMITNFHLPRSTPILMVAALMGRERLLAAYREAVDRRYRFYSYGDAMLVLPAEGAPATLGG